MNYVQPLSEYKYNLKSKKLEGLARLVKLHLPTVSNLFLVFPQLYLEFIQTHHLSKMATDELKTIFTSIRKQNQTVSLRNSIYESGNPGMTFCVHNSLNLKSFPQFLHQIALGYKKAVRIAIDPKQVEFGYLIQSFYSSEKCGTLLSDNGQKQIFIQAIFGQHTNLILRGDITPDEYLINKKTYKIASKNIAVKTHRIRKLASGIKKVRVKQTDQNQPVLSDQQVIHLAKLSQVLEKHFGPQEIEWAVLDSDRIIFQETRNLSQNLKLKFFPRAEVIFPAETSGSVININHLPTRHPLSDKIVVTNNLNIAFINKLAFLHRPKAVILTRGSLTSHAATILRESKITIVLTHDLLFADGEKIYIDKNGCLQKRL